MAAPRLVAQLGLDSKEFQREVRSNKRYLKGVERDFTAIGTGLTAGLTLPLVGVAAAGVKASIDLSAGMANVASLIPGATDRVKELKGNVQELAVETGTSTQDLTAGLYQTISAFGDTAESADRLGIAAKTAKAGVAGVGPTVSLLSAATKAYNDTSAEAVQRVADLSLATVRYGETDLPQLAANMGKVLPLSSALNVSQEELFATIATGTGPLGQTAEVTTQVKAALTAMLKPSKDMKAAYDELGVSSGKQLISSHGLVGAFSLLSDHAGGSEEALGKMFGSSEALNVVLGLSGSQSEAFAEKLEALEGASGSVNAAFLEQTEGVNAVGFQMEQAKQRAVVLAQRLGDVLVPVLGRLLTAADPLVTKLESAVAWFSALPEPVQNTALAMAAGAAAAGPLLLIVGKVSGALATVAGPATKVVKILGSVSPVAKLGTVGLGLLKGGLALLTGPIGVVAGLFVGFLASTEEGRELLGALGRLVGQGLVAAWGLLKAALVGVIGVASDVLTALVGMIPQFVLDAIGWLAEKANVAADSLSRHNTQLEGHNTLISEFTDPVAQASDALEELSDKADEAGESSDALAAGEIAVGAAASEAEPLVADLVAGIGNLVSGSDEAAAALLGTLPPAMQDALARMSAEMDRFKEGPIQGLTEHGELIGTNIGSGMARKFPEIRERFSGLMAQLRAEGTVKSPLIGEAIGAGILMGLPTGTSGMPGLMGSIGQSGGAKLLEGVGDIFSADNFSGLLTAVFTGGGDWQGAAKVLGAQVGGTLADNLGGMLTGQLSGFMGGGGGGLLGSIVGAGLSSAATMGISIAIPFAIKGFKALWGRFKKPSEAELAGRQAFQDFNKTLRDGLSEAQIAEAVAAGWEDVDLAKSWIGLRDAVLAAGGSIQQAEAYSERLFEAIEQGPEAVAAVRAEIEEFTGSAVAAQQEIAAAAEEAARVAEAAADRMSTTAVSAYHRAKSEGQQAYDDIKAKAIEAGATEEEAVARAEKARQGAISRTLSAERRKLVQTARFEAALAAIREGNAEGAVAAANKAASETAQAWDIAIGHVIQADEVASGKHQDAATKRTEKAIQEATREKDERAKLLAEYTATAGIETEKLEADFATKTEGMRADWEAKTGAIADQLTKTKNEILEPLLADLARPRDLTIGIDFDVGEIPDFSSYNFGINTNSPPGFATGTGGAYPDFGSGTLVELHGRERVMTEAEGKRENAALGEILAGQDALYRLLRSLPAELKRGLRDAVYEGRA